MAAAESGVSLVFHDITASGADEGVSTFLPRLMKFLEQMIEREVPVGVLYSAMLETGRQWRQGTQEDVELFAALLKIL